MRSVFVFSGQGAQFVGMGKDLYESSQSAKDIFDQADDILGWSIKKICFDGPENELTRTIHCQPAIYTMSLACLAAFQEKYPQIQPIGTAGLSLGEYAALVAAGVISFADGLKLLEKRAQFMDEACQQNEGAMASILGGDNEIIEKVCMEQKIDVANYNCPGQTVISGSTDGVKSAIDILKQYGFRKIIPLQVAGAFHSRLMDSAGKKLDKVLADVPFLEPHCLVAQNVTGTIEQNVNAIKSNLVSQVAGSVRWESCVCSLIEKGADTIIEFGPGNVLINLLKRTDKTVNGINIGKKEELESFKI